MGGAVPNPGDDMPGEPMPGDIMVDAIPRPTAGAIPIGGAMATGGGGRGALGAGLAHMGLDGWGGGGGGARLTNARWGALAGAALARDNSSTRPIGNQSLMPPRQTSVRELIRPPDSSDSSCGVLIIRRSSAVTWTIQS